MTGVTGVLGAGALLLTIAGCSATSDDSATDQGRSSEPTAQESTASTPPANPSANPSGLPAVRRYVAMGDSYTAAPLTPGTKRARGCLRASGNYPHLVQADLGADSFVDRSCSAADTTSIAGPQQTLIGSVPPQLAAVNRQTDLITLGIGGNDFGVFETMVTRCPQLRRQDPQGTPCRDEMRANGGDLLLDNIDLTEDRIVEVVEQIRAKAPRARVLLVGYPQIVPATGACPKLLPLARGDYAYGRTINRRLTEAVRGAARRTNVTYVDLWRGSAGHDICADEPWVNGQLNAPGKALSFHPFVAGQEFAAAQILRALR